LNDDIINQFLYPSLSSEGSVALLAAAVGDAVAEIGVDCGDANTCDRPVVSTEGSLNKARVLYEEALGAPLGINGCEGDACGVRELEGKEEGARVGVDDAASAATSSEASMAEFSERRAGDASATACNEGFGCVPVDGVADGVIVLGPTEGTRAGIADADARDCGGEKEAVTCALLGEPGPGVDIFLEG
jgi:hypothetical protein